MDDNRGILLRPLHYLSFCKFYQAANRTLLIAMSRGRGSFMEGLVAQDTKATKGKLMVNNKCSSCLVAVGLC